MQSTFDKLSPPTTTLKITTTTARSSNILKLSNLILFLSLAVKYFLF
jgi:hypothetical protein